MNLSIISSQLLPEFLKQIPSKIEASFKALHDAEISTDKFSFYTSVSSVYSSKIEGEEIELDSYIKHKKFGIEFHADYTKKIDDLYNAYSFAAISQLNMKSIQKVHSILGKHIVAKQWLGKIRQHNMYVTTKDGRIEYVAALPDEVAIEMKKFYVDLELLLRANLTLEQTFFYASMIHLVFVKIHPWNDGNGRSARLIEKWFLAEKLGENAWFIESEKYYYNHHQIYYKNIRALGLEYSELDYSQTLPFLLMLPQSLIKLESND